jgi:hypothetical protein
MKFRLPAVLELLFFQSYPGDSHEGVKLPEGTGL